MMRRFVMLPILALSALAAIVPAQASPVLAAAPQSLSISSGIERQDKEGKPRRPPPKPGPKGETDGES